MANVTMNARDSINPELAECFITIGDNRYNFIKNEQEYPQLYR